MRALSLLLCLATLLPGLASAYNADPWPGKRGSFGTHATVTRIAADFLASGRLGDAQALRAGRWVQQFVRDTNPAHITEGARRRLENALLRGANGPDRLDTAVDVVHTKLCFAANNLSYRFRIPGVVLNTFWGERITIWSGTTLTIPIRGVVDLLRRRIRDPYFQAFMANFGRDLCTAHLTMPGGKVPTHAAGMNHFMREGRPVGYNLARDPSIFDELPNVVREELRSRIDSYLRGKIKWSILQKIVSGATRWLSDRIAGYVRNLTKPVVDWVRDQIVNRSVHVERIRPEFRNGRPVRGARIRQPLGRMQFEAASVMADWWYSKARMHYREKMLLEAILSLGHVAHYLQDNVLPHHNWGFLMRGHGSWEDKAHPIIADLYRQGWHRSDRNFYGEVASILRGWLRNRGYTPGTLIGQTLWPSVRSRYRNLPREHREDPTRPVPGSRYRWSYAKHDLAHAVAATAWLLVKFHAEARESGTSGSSPLGGRCRPGMISIGGRCVLQPSIRCRAGTVFQGGRCVRCPAGTHPVGGRCRRRRTTSSAPARPKCRGGTQWIGGACRKVRRCPRGTRLVRGRCRRVVKRPAPTRCRKGTRLIKGRCRRVRTVRCPRGTRYLRGHCRRVRTGGKG